ncbi:hypothetical protein ACTU3I_08215 [Microbacterium sp. RD1]|uniref:hypothetical protein n=1 Tax=Microbacterium sp. RD1 TaxID=3457313 RepID=UPI003FA5F62A
MAGRDIRPWWESEGAGWGAALALSIGVMAVVASVSADLLFTDGDSLIVAMVARSLALGEPQDWALSPVLFLPETVLYAVLSLLGLGMRATLLLNGIVNLLALYGALRVVSGRRGPGRAPVAGALAAFTVLAVLAVLEGTARRDGAQFVTLFTTTTYYSATVVAMILSVGIVARAFARDTATPWGAGALLAVISAVSVLSNPLFAAWATLPLVLVLSVLAIARRSGWPGTLILGGGLVAGAIGGYAARGIFAGTIVAQSGNYLRFGELGRSAGAYGQALADLFSRVNGVVWLLIVAALWLGCLPLLTRAWRGRDLSGAFVALVALGGTLVLTVGAFLLGTDAVRYLQPWLFLPVAALAHAVAARPAPALRRRAGGQAVAIVAAIIAVVAVPVAVAAATARDDDLDCVVQWVDASGRTGAGQFWTVRAPKAHLDDPRQLIQVDHTLRVYTWLTNRADADDDAAVTFLVTDAATYPFDPPAGVVLGDAETVGCGRYTILDFGDRMLPLGPPRD